MTRPLEERVSFAGAKSEGGTSSSSFAVPSQVLFVIPREDLVLDDDSSDKTMGSDRAFGTYLHTAIAVERLSLVREGMARGEVEAAILRHCGASHPRLKSMFGVSFEDRGGEGEAVLVVFPHEGSLVSVGDLGAHSLFTGELDVSAENYLELQNARIRILLQAALALEHLHSLGIHHGNLTPSDVLIDAHLVVQLKGHGLLQVRSALGHGALATDPFYSAPEVFLGHESPGRTAGADMWSFASLVLWIMYPMGRISRFFNGARTVDNAYSVPFTLDDDGVLPPQLQTLLASTFVPDPSERPSAADFVRVLGSLNSAYLDRPEGSLYTGVAPLDQMRSLQRAVESLRSCAGNPDTLPGALQEIKAHEEILGFQAAGPVGRELSNLLLVSASNMQRRGAQGVLGSLTLFLRKLAAPLGESEYPKITIRVAPFVDVYLEVARECSREMLNTLLLLARRLAYAPDRALLLPLISVFQDRILADVAEASDLSLGSETYVTAAYFAIALTSLALEQDVKRTLAVMGLVETMGAVLAKWHPAVGDSAVLIHHILRFLGNLAVDPENAEEIALVHHGVVLSVLHSRFASDDPLVATDFTAPHLGVAHVHCGPTWLTDRLLAHEASRALVSPPFISALIEYGVLFACVDHRVAFCFLRALTFAASEEALASVVLGVGVDRVVEGVEANVKVMGYVQDTVRAFRAAYV